MESTPTFTVLESIDVLILDITGLSEEHENEAGSSSLPTPDEMETIENAKSPCLGMHFISLEAAKHFYIDYGKILGFSVVTRTVETDGTYQLMLKRLQELSLELKEIKNTNDQSKISAVDSCTVNENSQAVVDASQVLLMNPSISQTKGRKRKVKGYKGSTRIKGGLEKGITKATKVKTGRRCTCCKQVVVNHDRRNCHENPNRKKGISTFHKWSSWKSHRNAAVDGSNREAIFCDILSLGSLQKELLRRSGRNCRGMKEGLVLVYDCEIGEWSRELDLPKVIRRADCVSVDCS
ncbi:hypothetical protein IFM89_023886 [Coptis chinensis]|uniref:FAR1 domain-containing protein n=1 Tax=Coptis chinensis TaxID=261450 RepID=A0A835M6E5_9MAGN|nr:hypothetical protein IFM89_023886 [Coptis chinensis]